MKSIKVFASLAALAMVLSCCAAAAPPSPDGFSRQGPTNAQKGLGFPVTRPKLHWASPVKEQVVTFYIEPQGKTPELMSVLVASDQAQIELRKRQEQWRAEVQANPNLARTNRFPSFRGEGKPDFTKATWIPFKTNVTVDFGPGDGGRWLWMSFKSQDDPHPYWEACRIEVQGSPVVIGITNPPQTLTSQPMIQLQGFSSSSLDGPIKYELFNQNGGITARGEGLVNHKHFDNLARAFTTNYFTCYDVALSPGTNTFVLHAKDLAGYSVTTNFTFVFSTVGKTNPPVFKPEWPQDGMVFSASQFDLHGPCDDPTATVMALMLDDQGNATRINGAVERNGCLWVEHVPLAPGISYITIVTTDAATNSSLTNITIAKSKDLLYMDPVADPNDLWKPRIRVTGYYSGTNHSVLVNGVKAILQPDGHWAADNVPVNSPNGGGTASFRMTAEPGDERLTPSHVWQPHFLGEPSSSLQAGMSFVAVSTNEYNHYPVCLGITNTSETDQHRNWMLPNAESLFTMRLIDKEGKALPKLDYAQKSESALASNLNIHHLGKAEVACIGGIIPVKANVAIQLAAVNLDRHYRMPPPGDYRVEMQVRLFQIAEDGRLVPICLPPVLADFTVIDQPSEMTFYLKELVQRGRLIWGPVLNSLRVGVAHDLYKPGRGNGAGIAVYLENCGTNAVRNLRLPRVEEQFAVSLVDATGAEVPKTVLGKQRGLPLTIEAAAGGPKDFSRAMGTWLGIGDPRRSRGFRPVFLSPKETTAIANFDLKQLFEVSTPGKYRLTYQQRLCQNDSTNKLTGLTMPMVVVPIEMP